MYNVHDLNILSLLRYRFVRKLQTSPVTDGPATTRMLDLCTAVEVDFDIFQPEKSVTSAG